MSRSQRDVDAAAAAFIEQVTTTLDRKTHLEALAVSMFRAAEPHGIWDVADRQTKNYWRARAALRDAGPCPTSP